MNKPYMLHSPIQTQQENVNKIITKLQYTINKLEDLMYETITNRTTAYSELFTLPEDSNEFTFLYLKLRLKLNNLDSDINEIRNMKNAQITMLDKQLMYRERLYEELAEKKRKLINDLDKDIPLGMVSDIA